MSVVSLFQSEQPQPEQSRFEDAWKAYPFPGRQKKAMCRAKFEAITSPAGLATRTLDKDSGEYVSITLQATADEIIAGIRAYCEQKKATGSGAFGFKDGGKYILHFSTFLNQGRWEEYQ